MENGLRSNGIVFTDFAEGGESGDGSYAVSFGERSVHLDERDFTSATLTVSFGEMKFDLSDVRITDCAVIDATCSFGELSIRVPDYARVEINKSGAFSDVSCRHDSPADEGAPVVYINASCSFGEIMVR